MAFIRKVKTKSGATAVQIAHKKSGQIIKIEHIGSAHTDADLEALISLARQRLRGNQQSLFHTTEEPAAASFRVGLRHSFSDLLLHTLTSQYERLGLDTLVDPDFANLCLARIVEPTSKLDSLRVLADLGVEGISKDQLYRCLARVVTQEYRARITDACVKYAATTGLHLVLYDVTTLYFEIQKEDEYRKPGLSKERRLEPQIIVGLLVDNHGFPLGLQSFEGNKAETATILPVVEAFKDRYGLKEVTVVADAGMLSAKNLEALRAAGYHYIVGSRLTKIPYNVAEYRKSVPLTDGQIVVSESEGQRILYQYKEKRAALDIRNIQNQVTKAEKIVSGKTTIKRAKFLTVKTKEKTLNQVLITKAYALAGIKGYVTNLDAPNEQIIQYYHQLFNVEKSFRMAKSDLRARPIFHHKRDSIEAHLTIVLAALAVARMIENQTGLSIKQFVKTLRPIRSGIVTINGREYTADAEIPQSVQILLEKLKAGH